MFLAARSKALDVPAGSAEGEPTKAKLHRARRTWAWYLLVALAIAVYFGGIGSYPFLDPDEGRYAEIAREMLATRDFVTPHLNYVRYFEKPPLFYWLTAGAMGALGRTETAGRIVPALCGLATVLLVMAMGSKIGGQRAGLLAGWVYLTSLLPLVMARLLVIDGLFSLLLAGCWCCWWLGYACQEPKSQRAWYVGAWALLGLATMAKGPVAPVLTALLVMAFLALRRDLKALKTMAWWPGLLLWAVIVLPWHVSVSLRNPEFLRFFVVVQHIERFLGESKEHVRPAWFFFPIFILGLAAWGPMLLPAFAVAWRRGRSAIRLTKSAAGEGGKKVGTSDTAALYLLVWVAGVIIFFSASSCKLVPYILPAYPAAAVLVGWHLAEGGTRGRAAAWCAAAALLFLVLLAALPPVASSRQHYVPYAEIAPLGVGLQVILVACAATIGIAIWRRSLVPVALGLAVLIATPALIAATGKVARYRKVSTLAKALPHLPPEVRIAEWGCYDQSLGFYTRRRLVLVDDKSELVLADRAGKDRDFFLEGKRNLSRLAQGGPVLLNIDLEDWGKAQDLTMFEPVAANSGNLMLGNASFFRLTGLVPWPREAMHRPPILLYPRRSGRHGGKSGREAGRLAGAKLENEAREQREP
jgi:4-amino-4-deoxy-L-arabinose transferase-like glycosyltransferase